MIIDMARHVNTPVLSDGERRLFDAFVREWKAAGRSPEKEPVDGISPRQLRRYANGEVPGRLEDATKLAMSRYLANRGVEGFSMAVVHTHRHEMVRMPEWFQEVIRDDARAAVIRAEALREYGIAARLEAENARAREARISGDAAWGPTTDAGLQSVFEDLGPHPETGSQTQSQRPPTDPPPQHGKRQNDV